MVLFLIFLTGVLMVAFVRKFFAKFHSCACGNDLEEYIHALYQRYPKIDVDDIINLTQGLMEVQSIIDDGSLTTSLKADTLSRLWTDHKKVIAPGIKDGELFWTNFLVENFINEKTLYKHQDLYTFYNKIKLLVVDMPKKVDDKDIFRQIKYDVATILWLLNLLDQKGDCPSVVNVTNNKDNKDHDINYKNDYLILSTYTLLDHSLRVANNIIEILEKEDTGFYLLLPAIIAALGHDIGKIPEYFDVYKYTTSQHPSIGVQILKRSPFIKSIPKERLSIIENAILHHHSVFKENIANPILDKLKEADKMAREEEISLFMSKETDSGSTNYSVPLENNINLNFDNKNNATDNILPKEYTEAQDNNIQPKEPRPQESHIEEYTKIQENYQENDINNETDNTKYTNNVTMQIKEHIDDTRATNPNVFQRLPANVQTQENTANNSMEENNSKEKIKAYAGEKRSDITIDDENLRMLNSEEFLSALAESIKEKINIVKKIIDQKTGKEIYIFNAFTFRGSVYVTPYYLTQATIELCKQFNANDMANQLSEEKKAKRKNSEITDTPFARAVLQAICKHLEMSNFMDNEMEKEDYIGGYFDIYSNSGKVLHEKAYYTVLKIEMFAKNSNVEDVVRELEERKRAGNNQYLSTFSKIVIHQESPTELLT